MRLEVFQSGPGDCLLLTSADGKRMLIDGGLRNSFRAHVRPALAKLARDGAALDLVYVSHIDLDHISGVLGLMDDLVAWRVRDHKHAMGDTRFRDPKSPRPPEVGAIWHNAFHDQIGRNRGDVMRTIAASAVELETAAALDSASPELREAALEQSELRYGTAEGVELTYRVGPDQLDIPVNEPFGGKLIMARRGQAPVKLGSLDITVIGPFKRDLEELRDEWNEWLERNSARLDELRGQMRDDAGRLDAGEVEEFVNRIELRAEEFGRREDVTVPNLASLMLLVEEDGKTVLLTGDGHHEDILKGLKQTGKLDGDGAIHVDVLKIQHHGALANIHPDFCRAVTADHYVFCGNGTHHNPERKAIEMVIDSRLGDDSVRSPNPAAGGDFKLWFNSSAAASGKQHMKEVEQLVKARSKASGGRMSHAFLGKTTSSFEIAL